MIEPTCDEIITEIEMSWDARPWLAVEGESDEKLLKNRVFFRQAKMVVAHGWENVVRILTEITQDHKTKIVGLIDRDYRDHTNTQPNRPNLILTEARDLEGMLFFSSSLHKVYAEYGSDGKMPKCADDTVDYDGIRRGVLNICEQIGKFRSYCFVKNENISFQDLDYAKFIDIKTLSLDKNNFIKNLQGKNNHAKFINLTHWDLSQSGDHLIPEFREQKYICNGHDLMAVVAISLKSCWGSKSWGSKEKINEEIESAMRMAYEDSEFQTNKMWQALISALHP